MEVTHGSRKQTGSRRDYPVTAPAGAVSQHASAADQTAGGDLAIRGGVGSPARRKFCSVSAAAGLCGAEEAAERNFRHLSEKVQTGIRGVGGGSPVAT